MNSRAQITVGESWHYRLYRYWFQRGNAHHPDWGYQENLCHYLRVVLIWAPWWWFWDQELLWWWLRPSTVALPALAVAALIWGLMRNLRITLDILLLAGYFVAIVAAIVGAFAAFFWLKDRWGDRDEVDTVVRFAGLIGHRVKAAKHHICPLIALPDEHSRARRKASGEWYR